MIDYDKTIAKTLNLIADYLLRRADKAHDTKEYKNIIKNAGAVRNLITDTRGLRSPQGFVWNDTAGFIMQGSRDNTVFLAFNDFLVALNEYYTANGDYYKQEAQKKLLGAVKRWNYIKSNNMLKDFYFSFLSPERFAVKVTPAELKTR